MQGAMEKARGSATPSIPLTSTFGPNLMTSNFGLPFPDIRNSLNVNGWVLTADVHLMEKQQAFNRTKVFEESVKNIIFKKSFS